MDLLDLEARALMAHMRGGEVSCEAVMAATLERIEARNPSVNAIVSMRAGAELMDEARAADRQTEPRGVLHGLPMAIKDLSEAKGLECSQGSPIFAGQVSQADCLMVSRLRAAGAIFIGKTNTPEFGLGSHSYNPVHGVTRNPYDTDRSAGGSSGGAAAALATRMVALADGSDMMGSLRNPAGFCNVYGFRPSWGVVPQDAGGETFLQQLATNGPMARSPKDLALLLEVMAGPNPLTPHGAPAQSWHFDSRERLDGARIGWLGDWGGAYGCEPGILEQCEAGLEVFQDLGADVEVVPPPFEAGALWDSWRVLRHWAVASQSEPLYADLETRALLKPEAVWEIENGLALDAMAISRASAIRSRWFAVLAEMFDRFDALVLPTAQVWPFPATWHWPQEINGVAMDTYHRWMEVVVPVSLAGVPCINVPVGFGAAGLPMGMQVFARKGGDLALLQLADCYHTATNWPDITPSYIRSG